MAWICGRWRVGLALGGSSFLCGDKIGQVRFVRHGQSLEGLEAGRCFGLFIHVSSIFGGNLCCLAKVSLIEKPQANGFYIIIVNQTVNDRVENRDLGYGSGIDGNEEDPDGCVRIVVKVFVLRVNLLSK